MINRRKKGSNEAELASPSPNSAFFVFVPSHLLRCILFALACTSRSMVENCFSVRPHVVCVCHPCSLLFSRSRPYFHLIKKSPINRARLLEFFSGRTLVFRFFAQGISATTPDEWRCSAEFLPFMCWSPAYPAQQCLMSGAAAPSFCLCQYSKRRRLKPSRR